MNRLVRLAPALFLAALAGCADRPIRQAPLFVDPAQPVISVTEYDRALACLGDLVAAQSARDTPMTVSVRRAGDDTGAWESTGAEVPREISMLVKMAVNGIGARVRVAVDNQVVAEEITLGRSVTRRSPDVILLTAISTFDRGERNEVRRNDLSLMSGDGRGSSDVRGGRGYDAAWSSIMIQMQAQSTTDWASTRAQASVVIDVVRVIEDGSIGISVYGLSVGQQRVDRRIQGRHRAVQYGIQLATLKVFGTLLGVPYWRCAPSEMSEDDEVRTRALTDYARLSTTAQVALVQEALNWHGFLNVKRTGAWDKDSNSAFFEVLRRHNIAYDNNKPSWPASIWATWSTIPFDRETRNRMRAAEALADGPIVLRCIETRSDVPVAIDGEKLTETSSNCVKRVSVGDHVVEAGSPVYSRRIFTVTAAVSPVVVSIPEPPPSKKPIAEPASAGKSVSKAHRAAPRKTRAQ